MLAVVLSKPLLLLASSVIDLNSISAFVRGLVDEGVSTSKAEFLQYSSVEDAIQKFLDFVD